MTMAPHQGRGRRSERAWGSYCARRRTGRINIPRTHRFDVVLRGNDVVLIALIALMQ